MASTLQPKTVGSTLHTQICHPLAPALGARGKTQYRRSLPSTARAAPVLESVTSSVWDEKYLSKYGDLKYGVSLLQGRRDDMQDYYDVNPKARCGFLYAGVFDGHGGLSAAGYLSEHLYTVFSDKISEESYAEDCSVEDKDTRGLCCPVELSVLLRDSFLQMDKELLKWLAETQQGDEALSGSTATVLLVRNDKIVVANVGDSRAVLSRNGQPYDLSAEHRVTGKSEVEEAEMKRVESVGGWIADDRVCDVLAVSRAFGDPQFKGEGLPSLLQYGIDCEFWDQKFADTITFTGDPVVAIPDVTEIAVGPDDEFVVLATDGLWDVMSSKDVVDTARSDLQKGRSVQAVADKLANIALRRFSEDNIAVVVVDLGGGQQGWGHKKSGWRIFGG